MKIDKKGSNVEFRNQISSIVRQCNHQISSFTSDAEQQIEMLDLKLENNYIDADKYKNEVISIHKNILGKKIQRLQSLYSQLQELE